MTTNNFGLNSKITNKNNIDNIIFSLISNKVYFNTLIFQF